MIFIPLLLRQNQTVNINSPINNVNLYTQAGSPKAPINIYCNINSPIGSTSNATVSFQTGTGWTAGSYLYINNFNSITGGSGTAGTNGIGGAGGKGGSYPTAPIAGSAGGAATAATGGGIAFAANTVSGVKIALNNQGSIIGGPGGAGALGGGGGGGGGGYGRTY